jgi:hypothetical protein
MWNSLAQAFVVGSQVKKELNIFAKFLRTLISLLACCRGKALDREHEYNYLGHKSLGRLKRNGIGT